METSLVLSYSLKKKIQLEIDGAAFSDFSWSLGEPEWKIANKGFCWRLRY